MATCVSNDRLGRVGCGAEFKGNSGHSDARVPWSTHPDGRAHVTFASDEAFRLCCSKGGPTMADPATVADKNGVLLLEQDQRGQWRRVRKERIGMGDEQISDEGEDG